MPRGAPSGGRRPAAEACIAPPPLVPGLSLHVSRLQGRIRPDILIIVITLHGSAALVRARAAEVEQILHFDQVEQILHCDHHAKALKGQHLIMTSGHKEQILCLIMFMCRTPLRAPAEAL